MYVYTCCMYIHAYIHTSMPACMRTHLHMYVHTCIQKHMCVKTNTYIHVSVGMCMYRFFIFKIKIWSGHKHRYTDKPAECVFAGVDTAAYFWNCTFIHVVLCSYHFYNSLYTCSSAYAYIRPFVCMFVYVDLHMFVLIMSVYTLVHTDACRTCLFRPLCLCMSYSSFFPTEDGLGRTVHVR